MIEIAPNQFNLKKLKKSEIEWLYFHQCKHRHSYISHPSCYWAERPDESPIEETIGFFDIESSNLKASFGYVISYCIKPMGKLPLVRCITPKEIHSGTFDKRLLHQFYDDARQFTRLVCYWGKDRRHDVPFLRTRALKAGVPFPKYGSLYLTDLYDWTKNKLSLHSYRLETACREFGIPAKTHPLDGHTWVKAMAGNQKALDYIGKLHCKEDVVCLEPLYLKIEPYVRGRKESI